MPSLPSLSTAFPDLDAHLRERLWRADTLQTPRSSVASGFAALDAQLPGGGWPTHCLTELLLPAPGMGEMRLLAPCLSALARARRQIIVLASTQVEQGQFYPDGWAQLGIDPGAVLLVQAERPADRLWAVEQSLKSAAFGALLAWLPQARPDALRRLQLAAASADGLSFLLRPATAQAQSSAAPAIHSQERFLSVQLLKRRGPVLERPLLLRLSEPRPLRGRTLAGRLPTRTASKPPMVPSALQHHALGRPTLSDTAP
jgi:hypothetical protein